MMRLFTILLLPLFVAVQSMAAICSSECNLNVLMGEKKVESSSEQQGCHQSTEESKSSSDKKESCASKICQLDEVIKSEVYVIDLDNIGDISDFSTGIILVTGDFTGLRSVIFTTGPPGSGSFVNVPLFIQKSSYLI